MRYGSGFANVTYVGDKIVNTPAVGTAKIIWRTKRGVSPACTPSIRQQYASVPYTPPIRRRHSFYCSSNYLQSVRHTIYIDHSSVASAGVSITDVARNRTAKASTISTQMTSKSASISSFHMLEGAKNTPPPVYPQQLPVMPLTLQPHTPPSTSPQLFSPIHSLYHNYLQHNHSRC